MQVRHLFVCLWLKRRVTYPCVHFLLHSLLSCLHHWSSQSGVGIHHIVGFSCQPVATCPVSSFTTESHSFECPCGLAMVHLHTLIHPYSVCSIVPSPVPTFSHEENRDWVQGYSVCSEVRRAHVVVGSILK